MPNNTNEGGELMRIILDTDKRQIIVPWNYQAKLDAINQIAQEYGGTDYKKQTFIGYMDTIWKECIADTDKHVVTAQKRAKK